MRYQVDVPRTIRRQIDELPGHVRQRIKREIAQLAFNPRPDHAIGLQGRLADRYKIKLDQYRIVYRVDDEVAIVLVLKAGKKQSGFYDDIA